MAAHLERHPQVRCVVNFVPVLLDQIEDYAQQFDARRRFRDPLLRLLAATRPRAHRRSRTRNCCWPPACRGNHVTHAGALSRVTSACTTSTERARRPGRQDGQRATFPAPIFADLAGLVPPGLDRRDRAPPQATAGSTDEPRARAITPKRPASRLLAMHRRDDDGADSALARAGRARPGRALGDAAHPSAGTAAARFPPRAREAQPDCAAALHRTPIPGGRSRVDRPHRSRATEPRTPLRRAAGRHVAGRRRRLRRLRPASGRGRAAAGSASGERRPQANSLVASGTADAAQPPTIPGASTAAPGLTLFFRDERLSDLIGFEYAKWHGRDAAQPFRRPTGGHPRRRAGWRDPAGLRHARRRKRLGALPLQRLLFLRGPLRPARRPALARHHHLRRLAGRGRAPPRQPVRHWWPAAGCTAPSPPGSATADKNRGWDLLCEAKQAYDRVLASGRLDAARSPRPKRSWPCAKARTGSGGSATTTPRPPWPASTACTDANLARLYSLLQLTPPAQLDTPICAGSETASGGSMRRVTVSQS
jgi:hypothetical protein